MTLKALGAFLFETAKLVLVSLLIIVPIRYFVVQPFFVLGASMEPTFQNGDYLIIDEISYIMGKRRCRRVPVSIQYKAVLY